MMSSVHVAQKVNPALANISFRFMTSGLMNSDQWWVINNLFVYFLVYSAFSLINGSLRLEHKVPFACGMWHRQFIP